MTMSNEIVSYGEVTLSHENLTFIVSSALALTLLPKEIVFYDRSPKLPEGVSDWQYFCCIGIGHFDESIGACVSDEEGRSPPGGDI